MKDAIVVLAVLHPPKSPRATPTVAELVELVLRAVSSRVLAAGPESATVAADTGAGRNVRVVIERQAVRLESTLEDTRVEDEEHGGAYDDDSVNDDVDETAGSILEALQVATGWHVTSDRLLDFEPNGSCPSCGVESFKWQDDCAVCSSPLDPVMAKKARTPHQVRAKKIVDKLVAKELIVLAKAPGARSKLEGRLVECLKKEIFEDRFAGERLLGVLIDTDAVEEVFGDETTVLDAL